MPLPGTAHTAKLAVLWTTNNGAIDCENIFHVRDASDSIFATPLAYATGVLGLVNTWLRPIYFPQCAIVGLSMEDVRTFPFGGFTVSQTPAGGTAPSSSQALPSGCCVAVKKVTATLGRAGRGRWFHPITDAHGIIGAQDAISTATATMLIDGLTNFQAAVEAYASGSEVGLVSYTLAGAQRSAGLFSKITSWTFADLNIDSQRRRLQGRGR